MRTRALLIATATLLLLAGCTPRDTLPNLPGDGAGFVFAVDPHSKAVTRIQPEVTLRPGFLPSDTRILVPDEDLEPSSFHYQFLPGNTLIIRAKFRNIHQGSEFFQPFFFTPPPPGLIAWWPGDGNADDIADGHDGTLLNGMVFAPGKRTQGTGTLPRRAFERSGGRDRLRGVSPRQTSQLWDEDRRPPDRSSCLLRHRVLQEPAGSSEFVRVGRNQAPTPISGSPLVPRAP